MPKIVVVGSSNTDMVVRSPRFPHPGETIIGGDFFMFSGGKGANQAVAASRLGAEVQFICSVGDDIFGRNSLEGYKKERIDVQGCSVAKGTATGVALITVNKSGENEIVVAPGANNLLSVAHITTHLEMLKAADIILTQLEIPLNVVRFLADFCRTHQKDLIINPAPALPLEDSVLNGLFLITPNETETQLLTGVTVTDQKSAATGCGAFLKKGVQNVVITMGSRGAFFMNATGQFMVEAPQVTAIDTTAAGDVFNGALAVSLAAKKTWQESILLANRAAALSVTKMGAQSSAPYATDII